MIPAGPVIPFLTAGLGRASLESDLALSSVNGYAVNVEKSEKRNLVVFGGGLEVPVHRFISLRFDAIDHYISRDFIDGDWYGDNKTHNWEFGAGMTLLFGGSKTADETPASRSYEPTPAVAKVDDGSRPPAVREKPMKPSVQWADWDADGVSDIMDKCPDTPAGTPVDLNGCPKTLPEQYEIMSLFDFDRSEIKSEFTQALDELARLLINTGARLSLTGYADQVGTKEYNVKLSDRRAHAVRDYLVAREVPAERFELKAFGEYPVDRDGNPVAYYQRCVQFKLIK